MITLEESFPNSNSPYKLICLFELDPPIDLPGVVEIVEIRIPD